MPPRVIHQGAEIAPTLHGLATHYTARAGAITKSGERYGPHQRACAIDVSEWFKLRGKRLLIVSEESQIIVRVNDTGYLYRAGRFRRETRFGTRRWWPSRSKSDLQVVVDLPSGIFQSAFRDTTEVWCFELS